MNNQELNFIINNTIFSKKHPLIVAEIGTSHDGKIQKAKRLIDAAKNAGANVVKFQIIYADEILHPNTGFVKLPTGNIPLYSKFKEMERPIQFYKELSEYARKAGLLFSASPFGFRSAKELISLHPDFLKIASPELNYTQLLKYCARANIPMVISTGVSKLEDIEKAVFSIKQENNLLPICILHCVTAYPAPEDSYNISVIENLKNIFKIPVGVSDHSMDPVIVPVLSLGFNSCAIEKHICISRKEIGLDDSVALEPEQFKKMCNEIKKCSQYSLEEIINHLVGSNYSPDKIKKIIGTGKKELSFAEKENYGRTNRSLHYTKYLKKDSVITNSDIAVLRTEKQLSIGEHPDNFEFFIKAVLQKDVKSGDGVLFEDFIKRKGCHK